MNPSEPGEPGEPGEPYLARRARSFRHAGRGILHLLGEPNARLHALATVAVIALCAWVRPSSVECALVTLAVALVWAAEAFNTSLERLADAAVPERHPLVGVAKDVAAGAVLLAAIGAVVVAGFVFGPYLLHSR